MSDSLHIQAIKERDAAAAKLVVERLEQERPPPTLADVIAERLKNRPMRHWRIGTWRTSGYSFEHAWSNVKQNFNGVMPGQIVEIVPVYRGEEIVGWKPIE